MNSNKLSTANKARSKKYLEKHGYLVDSVEQIVRVPDPSQKSGFKMWRKDLFGVFDLVAIQPALKIIAGIQITSYSNHYGHVSKLKQHPNALKWLKSGGEIYCHGWRQEGRFWKVVIHCLTCSDINDTIGTVEISHDSQPVDLFTVQEEF